MLTKSVGIIDIIMLTVLVGISNLLMLTILVGKQEISLNVKNKSKK